MSPRHALAAATVAAALMAGCATHAEPTTTPSPSPTTRPEPETIGTTRAATRAAAWQCVADGGTNVTYDAGASVVCEMPTTTTTTLPEPEPTTTTTVPTIAEDDPRWDCHTMGNRQCSPMLPDGTYDPTSSDGRYHQCGLITDDGVTEELNAYAERCAQ